MEIIFFEKQRFIRPWPGSQSKQSNTKREDKKHEEQDNSRTQKQQQAAQESKKTSRERNPKKQSPPTQQTASSKRDQRKNEIKLECLIINPCAYLKLLLEELWHIKTLAQTKMMKIGDMERFKGNVEYLLQFIVNNLLKQETLVFH
ncbi:hypothetical protein Q3G72_029355 [Acer saccharum]|nr:hypothetical protein Q3G72_029355 [Acer saccharum]